jgi:hypothetical protein
MKNGEDRMDGSELTAHSFKNDSVYLLVNVKEFYSNTFFIPFNDDTPNFTW